VGEGVFDVQGEVVRVDAGAGVEVRDEPVGEVAVQKRLGQEVTDRVLVGGSRGADGRLRVDEHGGHRPARVGGWRSMVALLAPRPIAVYACGLVLLRMSAHPTPATAATA
jgi:hypothetical protein